MYFVSFGGAIGGITRSSVRSMGPLVFGSTAILRGVEKRLPGA
jgi:hypothetical protein